MCTCVWNSLLNTWTPALTPHTPQALILMEWPSHKGCAVMDIEYYLKVKNPCQIKIHLMREMLEINSHVYYFDSLAIVRKKHIRLAI